MDHTLFLKLLSASVGNATDLGDPSPEEWNAVFDQVRRQTLVGVTLDAFDAAPESRNAPLGLYSFWLMSSDRIAKAYHNRVEGCRRLQEMFNGAGIPCCILKGISVARFYPNPERRQSGDIDIWAISPRRQLIEFLRSQCNVGKIFYHHADCDFFGHNSVEVHFIPSWMNAPLLNHRLQRWFRERQDVETGNFDSALGCAVTTPEASVVLGFVHIWRHTIDEGVGLRQLMDLYYSILALPESSRDEVSRVLKQLSLGRFCSAITYVLSKIFADPRTDCLFEPDPENGQFLFEEIMQSGNFGRFDSRVVHRPGESRIGAFLRKSRRSLRFIALCPRDVLCQPLFKAWQFVWRLKNHYL